MKLQFEPDNSEGLRFSDILRLRTVERCAEIIVTVIRKRHSKKQYL